MNMSRNFLLPRSLREVEIHSTSCNARAVIATETLQGMFITAHVTSGNDPCNLCRNGATKLRDKLQEKLPSVTAP